tara:strand:+ start:190 stop:561 length:372 start_codon:yes stop_codon:yes gene_type:complete
MTGLREKIVLGIKRGDGTVLVPPTEYDPVTSEALTEMVEVGQTGTVTTWTWVQDPRDQSPWNKPHALAMILLDDSDTPFLHAVLAESSDLMESGMRVSIKWKQETEGHIQDIEGFVPEKENNA